MQKVSTAADHAARLIRQGTSALDAATIAAQQGGVSFREVQAELARRSGARRRTLRRIQRQGVA